MQLPTSMWENREGNEERMTECQEKEDGEKRRETIGEERWEGGKE